MFSFTNFNQEYSLIAADVLSYQNVFVAIASCLYFYSTSARSPPKDNARKEFESLNRLLVKAIISLKTLPQKAFDLFLWMTPKTTDDLIFCLFVHSLIMTMSTPIARILDGFWTQTDTVTEILRRFGINTGFKKQGYETSRFQDGNIMMHATCGITWLSLGTFQMTTLRRYMNAHRTFGYIAALALVAHLGTACTLLFADTLRHSLMNKLALAMDLLVPIRYAWTGMDAVIRKPTNIIKHIDCMVLCFIHSIEGAGTIRTIHLLQMVLGDWGPSTFIEKFKSPSTTAHGQWHYLLRMIAIRWLSNLYIAIYAYQNDNKSLQASFIEEVKQFAIGTIFVYVAAIFDLTNCVTIVFGINMIRHLIIFCMHVLKALDSMLEIKEPARATVDLAATPLISGVINNAAVPVEDRHRTHSGISQMRDELSGIAQMRDEFSAAEHTPPASILLSGPPRTSSGTSSLRSFEFNTPLLELQSPHPRALSPRSSKFSSRINSSDLREMSNYVSEVSVSVDTDAPTDKFIQHYFSTRGATTNFVHQTHDMQPTIFACKSAPIGHQAQDLDYLDMGWALRSVREAPETIRSTIRGGKRLLRSMSGSVVEDMFTPISRELSRSIRSIRDFVQFQHPMLFAGFNEEDDE